MKVYKNIKNNAQLSVTDSSNITGKDWELVTPEEPEQENLDEEKAPEKSAEKTGKAEK